MKKHSLLLLAVFSAIVNLSAQTGNVGINTTTPLAMLHVKDSSVLFQGATSLPGTPGNPPISSSGIRMMWYSDKAAFRAGYLNSSNSTKEKIGAYSFAAGYDPTARGEESIALGVDVIADSLICIAIGAAAKAYSVQDVSIGSFTVAQGGWSTAIGYEAKTTGRVTVAMGRSVVARAYNSVVVGCNNDSIGSSSLSSWVSTDPIFIIGNGSSSISRSNAMTVLKNARTGINTSTPLAMLHVENGDALFRGATILPGTPGNPPTSGQGIRMMWYQDKAAFRAGYVSSTQWDKDSIGDYSFATGESNKAKGKYAAAFGISNNVSGWGSAAMGIANIVSGTYSFASGGSHTVSGSYSAALGAVNTVSGSYSVAMGCYTTSRAYASVALGRYNDSIASSTTDSWVSTDPLFIIGNGTADNARSNAITVLKNAKTGINTSNPQYGLHVVNANDNDGGYLDGIMLENTSSAANTGEVAISFKNQSFLDANAKWIVGLNQSAIFRIDYGLSFAGNSAMSLDSIGNMTILGTLTQNSDARLKKNITPLQNSLQKILRLNGYHYNWIDSSRSSAVQTGVLAQEIEQEMPELVKTDEAGMKSVNYSGMIPYLIESVKELKQENDQLKMELMQLKSFIKEIAGNKK